MGSLMLVMYHDVSVESPHTPTEHMRHRHLHFWLFASGTSWQPKVLNQLVFVKARGESSKQTKSLLGFA